MILGRSPRSPSVNFQSSCTRSQEDIKESQEHQSAVNMENFVSPREKVRFGSNPIDEIVKEKLMLYLKTPRCFFNTLKQFETKSILFSQTLKKLFSVWRRRRNGRRSLTIVESIKYNIALRRNYEFIYEKKVCFNRIRCEVINGLFFLSLLRSKIVVFE